MKGKMESEARVKKSNLTRETVIVREYLESLSKPKTPTHLLERWLSGVEMALSNKSLTVTRRLELLQRKRNIERQIARASANTVDPSNFIAVAKSFSDRKGIEYATWREMGVPVKVLKDAGIRK
jgi:DNA mismatch repair ATPase MutS